MKSNLGKRCTVFLLGLCLSAGACAQYVWIDAKNIRHYSDRPPPPEVPQNRILKAPPGSSSPASAAQAGDPPSPDKPAAEKTGTDKSAAPPTLADKNAEFQKRRTEAADKEKKAAESAKTENERKVICERARSNAISLQSGERMTRPDASGERAFLSDEARAQELAEVRKITAECK